MQPQKQNTPKRAKHANLYLKAIHSRPVPQRQIQRRRILEFATEELPTDIIAAKAGTGERQVRRTLAGSAEHFLRVPAHLRLLLPAMVTAVVKRTVDRALANCERECFEEREVA